LVGIWATVLGIEKVGVYDNFFDLGGNSLLVLQVHQRIKETLEKELSVVDLFQYPTISALGKRLMRSENECERYPSNSEQAQASNVHQAVRAHNRKVRQKHRLSKAQGAREHGY